MNQLSDRAESFDAVVYLHTGNDRYRLKSIQPVTVQYRWLNEVRYDDQGNKALYRAGDDHSAVINLMLTADELDTAYPPTDPKTVSYWLYQKSQGFRVTLIIEKWIKTKAATNPYIHEVFLFDLGEIGSIRAVGGGIELPIQGVILSTSTGPSLWERVVDWNSANSYSVNQAVHYAGNGNYYMCILAVLSATPPSSDGTHWQQITPPA